MNHILKNKPKDLDEYWAAWLEQSPRFCPLCFLKRDKQYDMTYHDLDDHLWDFHRRLRDDGGVENLIFDEIKELDYDKFKIGDVLIEIAEISHGVWEPQKGVYLIVDQYWDCNEFEICWHVLHNEQINILCNSEIIAWKKLDKTE